MKKQIEQNSISLRAIAFSQRAMLFPQRAIALGLLATLLQACGAADGFPDGRVDPYAFSTTSEAEPGSTQTSESITVSGIDIPVNITIDGPAGSAAAYSIDNGEFTSEPGVVESGQSVRVRAVAADQENSQIAIILTIGDRSATYTIATEGLAIPQLVSTGEASSVRLSAAGDGTAMVIFVEDDSVFVSRYDGSEWLSPVEVDSGAEAAAAPDIATDANGNAVAVWAQNDGGGEQGIFSAFYEAASNTWGAAEEISTLAGYSEASPRVAMSANGRALAVWTQWLGDVTSTAANAFDGSSWGTSAAIEDSDDSMTNYSAPRVAIDGSGNGVAVWQGQSGDDDGFIYANRYIVGSGWESHALLGGEGESFNPTATVLSSGEALVGWEQFNVNQVFSSGIASTGAATWSAASAIGDGAITDYPGKLQLAADGQGNAMAAYLRNGDQVTVTRYVSGSGWESSETVVGTNPVAFGEEGLALALDDAGNGLLAFGTESNIAVVTYSAGAWSSATVVDQGVDAASNPVASAHGASGKIFYGWQQTGAVVFSYTPETN